MPYRFAVQAHPAGDLASGHVLRSAPGQAAFPVRLARELYEQARALLPAASLARGLALYDPCCGAGHLLATLGLLYGRELARVIGSDVDQTALGLARANLALLAPGGLAARAAELEALHAEHGRPSHQDAVAAARRLEAQLAGARIGIACFAGNASDASEMRAGLGDTVPDIVVADLPYGRLSRWQGAEDDDAPAAMSTAIAEVLPSGAVVGIATGKDVKIDHAAYRRARQMRAGVRRLTWLVRR